MDTFDVAKSKEERMKRLQARKRDRGGIFEAPTHNPLLDILLGNFSKTPDDKAKDTLLGTKSTRSKKTKQSKNAKGKHGTNDTALTGAEGTTRKVETARFSPPPQANGSPGGTEDEECTSKQDTKCSKRPRSKTAKVSTDAISATSKKRRDKDEPLDPTRESDSRPLKRQKAAQEKPTTKQNAKAISRSKPVKAKQAALPKEGALIFTPLGVRLMRRVFPGRRCTAPRRSACAGYAIPFGGTGSRSAKRHYIK
ncbi:hypothetical protein BD410DRAFT_473652 [Rickenella mellea]|uniref:Uncharacterized protein n=1 Tax=Rickenella mellea TaxID=50990 RepID=A0A4Y7QI00_9AGAM|nr:hypothetical protein BD410DRAFT_473652 [Rickenella mellea]